MRIGPHGTMTGEVLGDGRHSRFAHARHVRRRERRHGLRIAMKGPVADDLAQPIIQVDAGSEAEIHADGPQLGCHQPTEEVGLAQGVAPILVVAPPEHP